MSSSFRLVYWIGLWLCLALSPPSTSVSSDFVVLCKCLKNILTSLYLVEGLVWWDWPFTWWTDQLLSFSAWHCWLGHLTGKNRPDMTYNVFGGTLNPTLLLCHTFALIMAVSLHVCVSCCRLADRLYQTAAVTKRLPKPNEVLVSIDGSPLMNCDRSNSAFVLPVEKSQVSESLHLYKCSIMSMRHWNIYPWKCQYNVFILPPDNISALYIILRLYDKLRLMVLIQLVFENETQCYLATYRVSAYRLVQFIINCLICEFDPYETLHFDLCLQILL